MAKLDLAPIFKLMEYEKASDLFVTAGLPISIKVGDHIRPVLKDPLSAKQAENVTRFFMTEAQQKEFAETRECQFVADINTVGRFRVSCFYQRNQPGMVMRRIETHIPSMDELSLPGVSEKLAMLDRGIVIVAGAAGSGKSTTLAALVNYRNHHSSGHIVCIEDPIEFEHQHGGCIITQRELGVDTHSWETALGNTLRQSPDVVVVGDIYTRQAMEYAIRFAETGHLCLCCLHASNVKQAIERVMSFFQQQDRGPLLTDLARNLKGVIAQRFIPRRDGKGHVAAFETMYATPSIQDALQKDDFAQIMHLMDREDDLGMQTFSKDLTRLFQCGEIGYRNALRYADSENEVRLAIKFAKDQGGSGFAASGNDMELVEKQEAIENAAFEWHE